MKNDYSPLKPLRNRYYEQIKKVCAQHHIQLITVMTPVCENVKGMDYFQKVKSLYPEIYNCENFVEDDRYFSSCGHLNDAGARVLYFLIFALCFLCYGENYFLSFVADRDAVVSHHVVGVSSYSVDLPERIWLSGTQKKRRLFELFVAPHCAFIGHEIYNRKPKSLAQRRTAHLCGQPPKFI
jgi:hypothetical protein